MAGLVRMLYWGYHEQIKTEVRSNDCCEQCIGPLTTACADLQQIHCSSCAESGGECFQGGLYEVSTRHKTVGCPCPTNDCTSMCNDNLVQLIIMPSLHPPGGSAKLLKLIAGINNYEERQLYNLFLLARNKPRYRIVFVSSTPIDSAIISYYLGILRSTSPSYTAEDEAEWRSRLVLLYADDYSGKPLGQKVLSNPSLLVAMRQQAQMVPRTGLVCVNTTTQEEEIARQLNVQLLAVKMDLVHWGTKHGSRLAFARSEVPHPRGTPLCKSAKELAWEIARVWLQIRNIYKSSAVERIPLKTLMPSKFVIKLTDAFSGEGNAIFTLKLDTLNSFLEELENNANETEISPIQNHNSNNFNTTQMEDEEELTQVAEILFSQFVDANIEFQATNERWQTFEKRISKVGAIAEILLEGLVVHTPSVQGCIDSDGTVYVMSTHEQVMRGQCYLGCKFPARSCYRLLIQRYLRRVGNLLASSGVIGHFSVDFLARLIDISDPVAAIKMPTETSVKCTDFVDVDGNKIQLGENATVDWTLLRNGKNNCVWDVNALEINLRPGGTTHPMMTLRLLGDGFYDEETGLYNVNQKNELSRLLRHRYYIASDNIMHDMYKGLDPAALLQAFSATSLHYNGAKHVGTIFHLLGCLTKNGKLGMTCIACSEDEAQQLYDNTIEFLNNFASQAPHHSAPTPVAEE
jgi:hypothetical protein